MKRQDTQFEKIVCLVLKIIFSGFVGLLLILYIWTFSEKGYIDYFKSGMVWEVVFIYAGIVLLLYCIYMSIKDKNDLMILFVVFAIAIIPRLLLALLYDFIPHSDFEQYFEMGSAFYYGEIRKIHDIVASYKIPDFAGLGVLNGIIAMIFRPSMQGFQIAHAVMTSGICAFIFLIGKRWNKQVGIVSAFLFAIYPSNIVMSQVNTNQHGSILFVLLTIYLFLLSIEREKQWQSIIIMIFAGISLRISQYFHPSTITTQIALVAFIIGIIVSLIIQRQKNVLKICFVFILFFLSYYTVGYMGNYELQNKGICPKNIEPYPYLSKFVVGINYETMGICSFEDYELILSTPKDRQNELCWKLIKERTSNVKKLSEVLRTKTQRMWCYMDSSFTWYTAGLDEIVKQENGAGSVAENLSNTVMRFGAVDVIITFLIYLFAILGILFNHDNLKVKTLLLWVVLGWMGVHVFIETQERYRYFAMPFLFIFATIGFFEMKKNIKKYLLEVKKKI